jgi:hypothetical protein
LLILFLKIILPVFEYNFEIKCKAHSKVKVKERGEKEQMMKGEHLCVNAASHI